MPAINGATPDMLWYFCIVLISIMTVALLVCNLLAKIKELRKPKDENRKTVDDKLANDEARIKALERDSRRTQDEMKLLMRGELAMLHHAIDGNHTESLKEVQGQLEYYLTFDKMPG